MLRRMLDDIARRRRYRQLELQNPTAAKVWTLVPKCLVCDAEPVGHHFAEIASMPCGEETKEHVVALFQHVNYREWEALKDFRHFKADQDDAIVYAVTGPHEGGMVVLIRDPADLYSSVEIYLEQVVTAEEVGRIKTLVPMDAWKELGSMD